MLYKNTLLKIKKHFGRYISLLIIIMIGVGFYAGIEATAPDIIKVADSYYRSNKLMDFKIVSTLGLTDNDVKAIKQVNGVANAVASYLLDVQSNGNAIRIHAIEDEVNTVRLIEGQMPKRDTQCVADSRKYKIGDTIEITDNDDKKLNNSYFTVVGLVDSVLYLSEDYGSTTVGSGKLFSFIFVNKGNFNLDAYTEIYVALDANNTTAYSSKYKSISAKLRDELVKIKPEREQARHDEIISKAQETINNKESKLNDERSKIEKELTDAKCELDKNAQKLQDGKIKLAASKAKLEESINTKNAEFTSAKQIISDSWAQINAILSDAGITKEELSSKIINLKSAIADMKAQLEILTIDSPEYTILNATLAKYWAQFERLKQLKDSVNTLSAQEKQLNDGIATFNTEISKARNEIANNKAKLAANEQELNNGYAKYKENLKKFNANIADAQKKIVDAKSDLSYIEHPKWYIYDRSAVVGYNELESGISVVSSIATILPLLFILIALLMTSNSMTRMITEERGELGTLTSLGYHDESIIFTYLLYVLSASGLGATLSYFIGCRFIPPLVYSNFTYILPPLAIEFSVTTFGAILFITLVLMTVITVFACNKELKHKPAYLMRPLPPKHGQKIFLEKVSFIWKHLSFTWKITMRNMFRYKKRAFMTILGVAGCTSLLLVAFGLHDSMDGIVKRQYGEIFKYSTMITLKDEISSVDGELKELLEKDQIIEPLLIRQSSFKCEKGSKSLDFYIIAPQSNELFEKYYHLVSTSDKKEIALDDNDIAVTQRIANVMKLKKGDTFTISDSDNNSYNLTVTYIVENYASNYVYMNISEYKKVFGKTPSFNTIVSKYDGNKANLAKHLIDSKLAVNVTFTDDAIEKVNDSTSSLTGVIILITLVATLLAIVVLYNLTSINISERTREIATLKVLGFRDGETNAYIYREAFILTLLSIGIGITLGSFLHTYVINIIETGAISLLSKIKWYSYILACALTLTFSFIMQVVTYFKLRTIDMIESLKSVE